MTYFKTLFLIHQKNRQTGYFFFLLLLVASISLINTLGRQQETPYLNASTQRQAINASLQDFRNVDLTSPIGQQDPLYLNLVAQSALLARQEQSLLFDDSTLYHQTSLDLATTREAFYQLPAHQSYQRYVPSANENQLNKARSSYFLQHDLPFYTKENNLVLASLILLSTISVLWMPLAHILTSKILLDDLDHLSIQNGFPVSFLHKMMSKILFYLMMFVLGLFLLGGLCGLASLFFPFGRIDYPVAIYLTSFQTVPFWLYSLLIGSYFFLLAVFCMVLNLTLNFLTNQVYTTIFIGLGLYLIPYFAPQSLPWLFWLPSFYLDPVKILQGTFLQGTFSGSYFFGLMVVMGWTLAMVLLLKRNLSSQKLVTRRNR